MRRADRAVAAGEIAFRAVLVAAPADPFGMLRRYRRAAGAVARGGGGAGGVAGSSLRFLQDFAHDPLRQCCMGGVIEVIVPALDSPTIWPIAPFEASANSWSTRT